MNLIKNRQTMAHSASQGHFEGPFSPTMNLTITEYYLIIDLKSIHTITRLLLQNSDISVWVLLILHSLYTNCM